ncbi:MAG: peptidase S7 [Firmicutes bacterium HGW-Firmicutes-8]|nr:MAG: peptidase S7 [Firmicutes bacterium HGW-Firmicutes-8]
MKVNGIAGFIVDDLVNITKEISQGRNAGCLGFINKQNIVDRITPIAKGGLAGLPLRKLLNNITDMNGKSLIEGLEAIPDNSVLITTRPGKTGLITDVSGIDFFNMPLIAIGVKNDELAGVGIIYPQTEYFDLATKSEEVELKILAAHTAEEEKEVLRASTELSLKYLDVSTGLEVVKATETEPVYRPNEEKEWKLPRLEVKSISGELAEKLVAKSMEVGQGREVAAIGIINEDGSIEQNGEVVVGGIGFVPSRILASSCVSISGKSLRHLYAGEIPANAVIVHTHPGGTGVMHIGDANAGPGSWGRPIVAIGHDSEGKIRGATVIETIDKVFEFADEDEELGQRFFEADTPEEEAEIRNRKFGVAQEYTNLCKPIEIKH